MTALTHLLAWGKRARPTGRVRALMNRHRASDVREHAVNFAKGILIGGSIALFVWLNID
jgi:hypothetical protein